jgi:hypothetical protein
LRVRVPPEVLKKCEMKSKKNLKKENKFWIMIDKMIKEVEETKLLYKNGVQNVDYFECSIDEFIQLLKNK